MIFRKITKNFIGNKRGSAPSSRTWKNKWNTTKSKKILIITIKTWLCTCFTCICCNILYSGFIISCIFHFRKAFLVALVLRLCGTRYKTILFKKQNKMTNRLYRFINLRNYTQNFSTTLEISSLIKRWNKRIKEPCNKWVVCVK